MVFTPCKQHPTEVKSEAAKRRCSKGIRSNAYLDRIIGPAGLMSATLCTGFGRVLDTPGGTCISFNAVAARASGQVQHTHDIVNKNGDVTTTVVLGEVSLLQSA